jgi:hypothetical protein
MTDALMYAVNKSDLNTTALITDFDSNTPHMAIRKNLHSAKTALLDIKLYSKQSKKLQMRRASVYYLNLTPS